MGTRYENQNEFPISIPCKRGGLVSFAPGESKMDLWFSRFCGKRQLTAISDGVITEAAHVHLDIPRTPLEELTEDVQEENDFYKKINGIYTCKKCDQYRTSSITAMKTHLEFKHQIVIDSNDDTLTKTDATKPVVGLDSNSSNPEPPENTNSMFICETCQKEFKSARGLKLHISKMHKEVASVS